MGSKKLLFLTLKIFSATGGIEKVCKIAGKSFYEYSRANNIDLSVYAMHDKKAVFDSKYFPNNIFKAFNGNKLLFGVKALSTGICAEYIILSHVNLLLFGYLIKLLKPSVKLILFAHGIEVWKPFGSFKNNCLKKCNTIICVSSFTKQKIVDIHKVDADKCIVVNNCLDPFLPQPNDEPKNSVLLSRYGISRQNIIMLTLSRLSAHDRHKGYEKVIVALNELKFDFPNLVYLIAGKYDEAEKQWIDKLTQEYKLENRIILTGYVAEEELAAHIKLADLYVMPSIKEGFGIIFIESLFYGIPVIGGNKDGSLDALANGLFGQLVDPDSQSEVTNAIRNTIEKNRIIIPDHKRVVEYFGYSRYKENLLQALNLN